jgi:hypothetical protein
MRIQLSLFVGAQLAGRRGGAQFEYSSCRPIGPTPRLPIGFQLVAHRLSPVRFAFGEVFAELLKTSIVMVSDVGVGLAELLSNLFERVALKKM